MQIAQREAIAESLAYQAGQLALSYYRDRSSLVIESKGAHDLVSVADRDVERQLRQRIERLFPGEGFLGEEFEARIADSGRGTWVVDPIDGTWCFVNGISSWCISIAYVNAHGDIEVGVIFDPNTGEMFSAGLGLGTRLNGRPAKVADANGLTDGSLSVGYSRRLSTDDAAPVIDAILDGGGIYHRHGSGALGLAWTSVGRLIGYVERHMNSWDCLAGLLLVREAGGWTNDFLADDGLVEGNPVLAGPRTMKAQLHSITDSWRQDRVSKGTS